MNKILKYGVILLASSTLAACGASERISNIGKAPEMTKISNPTTQREYQPVSLPMPSPKNTMPQKNSLWAADRTTFFKDQRASDIGDIITVVIEIDDEAELENETSRSRSSNEEAALPSALGYEDALDRVLPEAVDPTSLIDFGAGSNHSGEGSVEREEEVSVQLAAIVTQILPNGNMVIHGSQEVLVNFEKRILQIDGVIRPEDISVRNTISYEQIAEARIVYGGEGQITDVQQPRYGQQLYDVIFPF
ncbi:MAG: flagellar basal body L-ring protein FlgH [Alphaproteobacteria bacterium]|nr:flagellar basal body L-ring protein FlgH [Alphaproteobacteria bacterium]